MGFGNRLNLDHRGSLPVCFESRQGVVEAATDLPVLSAGRWGCPGPCDPVASEGFRPAASPPTNNSRLESPGLCN